MSSVRIIPDQRDSSFRPMTHAMSDALDRVIGSEEMPPESVARLRVVPSSDPTAYFSALTFRSSKGDEAWFALPIMQGCWARNTFGDRKYFTMDRLDEAEVDGDGNVALRDGTFIHAVSFDTPSLHHKLPELEETIVYLTIRYLGAKEQCFRFYEAIFFGIDYGALRNLRVPNVKGLARYVNDNIGDVLGEKAPRKLIAIATVQRTLDIVGIQKARGRPKALRQRTTVSP